MELNPSAGRFLLPLFLLFCFGGVFYTYYKPGTSWLSCPNVPVSTHEACTAECVSALMGNSTRGINNASALNILVKQQPQITTAAVIEAKKEDHDSNIIMLIWYWPFGFKFDVTGCSPKFGIEGCHITDDRSLLDKAHGVMIHHRDIGGDLIEVVNRPRPTYQKWVWMNMESPTNSYSQDWVNNAFNITSSYRRDSDVWVPYGRVIELSDKNKTFQIPPKDKTVCWIVSHWNPSFWRVNYFNELSKFIKIETYGRHFNRYVNDEDYHKILPTCKFYLSFENSIHKDYFTEKVFSPLTLGTVPVVIGPPRDNYEEVIPANSFIHVQDFKSAEEMAKHLTFLDQNQEAYEQYFTWRKHFTVESTPFGLEHACRCCEYLRNYKGYRVFKNLNAWYWV